MRGPILYLCRNSGNLHRVEEPAELSQTLRSLGDKEWKGLRLTECDILSAYGGLNNVLDEEVSRGWSNRINQDACNEKLYNRHDILLQSLLLFREGGRGLPALYLVDGLTPSFYLWDHVSNDISKIEPPAGL